MILVVIVLLMNEQEKVILIQEQMLRIRIILEKGISKNFINNLIKHSAVTGVLDKGNNEGESSATQKIKDLAGILESRVQDMHKLPEMPSTSKFVDSEDYINSDDKQLETSPRNQRK